ncbi:MAG: FtsQ-type POTRA domain-containing protein [Spirochaetales bacterium]|nr:FtsQ-type POTRA domain-containing protein [Spirochaetales bacterium]
MSSVIIPSETYSIRKKKGRGATGVERIEKLFTAFIIVLLGIIVLELVFHFLIAPSVRINRVVITAESGFSYSDEILLKQAGISKEDTFFSINSVIVEKRLMLLPAVRSVSVKKVFPSVIKIDIKTRVPVGLSLVSTDTGIVPVAVDSEGVVFMTGVNLGSMDLPVISGLDFPEVKGGMRIPKVLCSFLEDLAVLKKSAPELYGLISEIKFVKKSNIDYEVLLYPRNYQTRIRIGSTLSEEMLKYMVMVLEVISGKPGMEKLEEIDFRTGDVVYRIQGE